MSNNKSYLREAHEIRHCIYNLLSTCTVAWQHLVLGEEKKAMGLMTTITNLLEKIISAKDDNPLSHSCYENIASLLPRLLKAIEERNGIMLADVLEHELKPILEKNLKCVK